MRRTVVTALAVLTTLTFGGPAAATEAPGDGTVFWGRAQVVPNSSSTGNCLFVGFQQDDATGQNVEGVLVAVAIGQYRYPLTCYLTVNGTMVAATPPVPFSGAHAGRAVYSAGETDSVEICANVRHLTECGPLSPVPVLDPAVYVPLCTLLPRGGIQGVFWVGWDGDVYLLGERMLDCRPYGWSPSATA